MRLTEHARKPLFRRTCLTGLAHEGGFAPTGAPSDGVKRGTSSLRFLGLTFVLAAAFIAVAASPALAKPIHVFKSSFGTPCPIGPCALGQLTEPSAVAINEETGDTYVADKGNSRVQIFDSTGTATAQFNGSAAPTGAFSEPTWIAIDNSPASESFEDVYVSDNGHSVIDKFSATGKYLGQITEGEGGSPLGELFGLATDPEGKVWVFEETPSQEGEVDHYTNAEPNAFTASCTDPRGTNPGLAVDSEDNLYLNTGNKTFAKFDSTCTTELVSSFGNDTTAAAVVDPEANDVYVDNLTSIGLFDPAANLLDRFGEGHLTEGAGLAVDSGSPEKLLYVADQGASEVRIFKQTTLPDVTTEAATEVKAHSAVLNGTVNPASGGEVTSCRFAWGTTPALEEAPLPCATPTLPEGSSFVPVSATLATEPNTTYYFRLEAENANGLNEGEASQTQHFTTPGPATIEATYATEVSADSAILGASIALHGVPTTYRFEYGETTAYGTSVPVPDGQLGSGTEEVTVSQAIHGLAPYTTYHYRVRTDSEVEPGVFEETIGPDATFITQPATSSSALLDDRQWQLVSPPDKQGGTIQPITEFGIIQAAASGGAMTYFANAPTEAGAQGYAQIVQVYSTRGASGWASRDIANPHAGVTSSGIIPPEYVYFANDLATGLFQPWGLFEPSLSPVATEQTPYLRALGSCSTNCSTPLLTTANALPGFGEERRCEEENGVLSGKGVQCGATFVGATPDLRHVALISPGPLSPGAGREQLYEWSADGTVEQISLLPENGAGEELPAPDESARLGAGIGNRKGGGAAVAKRAISADGSRIFWEDSESRTLYLRDTEAGHEQTIQLDTAEEACEVAGECESGGGRFQIAAADGSSVLFTDERRLTQNSGAGGVNSDQSDLYECRIEVEASGRLACALTDLTLPNGAEAAAVQGSVLGASEDDSTVYFVADGVLAHNVVEHGAGPEEAQPGDCSSSSPAQSCNLYLLRNGVISFISSLSGFEANDWERNLHDQTARVSPDGRYLAFMAQRSLTGYDNRDALSGKPDAELYEFDASTDRLNCASCDPTGARPHGVEYRFVNGEPGWESLVGGDDIWRGEGWVAALMPGSGAFENSNVTQYQSRALSTSGRLFFNSLDSLAPQDSNNQWDVYQYEPQGVGNCAASTPGYQQASQTCLGLISSGASGRQSAFLDASESGSDVFFLTDSRLVSQDVDAARDVYDAHECSTAVPCFPAAEPSPPACAGDACQQPATPPNHPTPGTLLQNGPENVKQCPKGKVKKSGKCVKQKAKKKHHVRHERNKGKHKHRAKKHQRKGTVNP